MYLSELEASSLPHGGRMTPEEADYTWISLQLCRDRRSAPEGKVISKNTVKLRHTVALALVGWYLMMPPSIAFHDSTCPGGTGWPTLYDAFFGILKGESPRRFNVLRCNSEQYEFPSAEPPLSDWIQIDSFETLDACKDAREKEIVANHEDRNIAELDLTSERNGLRPSKTEVDERTESIARFKSVQASSSLCVSSGDPRLKP